MSSLEHSESDSHEHHGGGGHELEAVDAKSLTKILLSLSIVVVLAVFVVAQWFYKQRDQLILERGNEKTLILNKHRKEMRELTKAIHRTKKVVEANPDLLKAGKAPAGWIHPDDVGKAPSEATGENKPN